jgi:hypothetical protein
MENGRSFDAGGAFVGGLVAALIARKWRLILGAIAGG